MAQDLYADFRRYLCPTSAEPLGLLIERAEGCVLQTPEGRTVLDFVSGIAVSNVGHGRPEVLRAITAQVERHLHLMVYGEVVQEAQVTLARRLAEIAPGDLSMTFFCNSGAEAIEGALKLCRKVTGRARIVAFAGGYHGDTLGALSIGGESRYQKPFEPLLPEVHLLPFDACDALAAIDERVAGVVVEPIQGEAGIRVPGPDFLPALRARCGDVGALLILDEVQTGIGRTGRWFACEHWGVVPDCLVLAKAVGGGMPLGAFMARTELMRTLSTDPPFAHVTTFGGHPVSCAAGLAALRFIEKNGLLKNAEMMGGHIRSAISRIEGVKEVRGIGLLLGVVLEEPSLTRTVLRLALERGLLVGDFLNAEGVIRVAPPLVVSRELCDRAVEVLGDSLRIAQNR
ncbi:MAG: aspartate aminotransferase family protein [Candidatus Methylomirabilales bacterium]